MTERMLKDCEMIVERPIRYSEVTAAMFDLDFLGDPSTVDNAKAALLRAEAGPMDDEAWMVSEGNTVWQDQVNRLRIRLEQV